MISDNYKSELEKEFRKKFNNVHISGGYCYIKPFINGKEVLKDVTILDFSNFYANLFIRLYDNGFLSHIEGSNIEKLRGYLKSKELINKNRIFINGYYGELTKTAHGIIGINTLQKYVKMVYSDICYFNGLDILYIDTDLIIYKGSIDLLDFKNIPLEIKKIEHMVIKGKKEYIYYDNDILVKKGFFNTTASATRTKQIESIEDILRKAQRIDRRNDKIEIILDFQ